MCLADWSLGDVLVLNDFCAEFCWILWGDGNPLARYKSAIGTFDFNVLEYDMLRFLCREIEVPL